jgi:hypothetical protein
MNESISMCLHLATEEGRSPLLRVADHYAGIGWATSQIIACALTLRSRPVLSMLDLEPRDRVHYKTMPAAAWPLRIELYRFRNGTSGKRDDRVVQFGPSSIRCPWLEHAVESLIPWKESAPTTKKARRDAGKGAAHIVGELRALSCNLETHWAVLSNTGRGPSEPELSLDARPLYADVSTLFLSDEAFDPAEVDRIARLARAERWPLGCFLTVNPFFGGPAAYREQFEREAWSLLRDWRKRMRTAAG